SKIITSILSFISGRLATKSNQIKQLIRNGRSASLQRTFKKSFTSFSHSTRNKTRDGLIRVSYQIKQLIRNGRSASLQRTFKKSFTSFSHSTRNKTRDGLIRVRNIRALNGRFNTSITHAYSIVIGSK